MLKPRCEPDFSSFSTGKLDESLDCANEFCLTHPEIIFCYSNDKFYQYRDGKYHVLSYVQMHKILLETDTINEVKKKSRLRRHDIIENIKHIFHYSIDDFNQEHLVNFRNCYFDLSDMSTHDHNPEILSTIQLPYEYDPQAKCPLWETILLDIFEGAMDKVNLLQEFFGYCLTKETKHEKALFCLGDGGNGKSTVLDGLINILGSDNVSSLSLKDLSNTVMLDSIINKYANVAGEIPRDVGYYEEAFKTITSGQDITVNPKYKDAYTVRPYCKLVFAANKMPNIKDRSDAVYRRLLLLDFNKRFEEHEQDKNLRYKIKEECAGMFNWAVKGLKRLKRNGCFDISNNIKMRIEDIREENNAIIQFVKETIYFTSNEEDYIKKDDFYKMYNEYLIDNNLKSYYSKNNFAREFIRIYGHKTSEDRRRYVDGVSPRQHRVWTNIRLKTDEEEDEIDWEEN